MNKKEQDVAPGEPAQPAATPHLLPAWTLTVAIGVLVCLLLRDRVLDAYPVPTPSMEPTIEGDEQNGDVVLVEKLWRPHPARFDTVVFRHERDGKFVVKRVVGLPGESIMIRDHDLWVGSSPADLSLVHKQPCRDHDLLATYWDSNISEGGFGSSRWLRGSTRATGGMLELAGKDLRPTDFLPEPDRVSSRASRAWQLRWNGRVMTGYLDGFGILQEGTAWAYDFGIEAEVRASPGAAFWVELRHHNHVFTLSYDGQGAATFWRAGQPVASFHSLPALAPDRVARIIFLYLDGEFWLGVDGKDIGHVPVPLSELKASPLPELDRPNGLALGATKGSVFLDRLQVVHDFHYLPMGSYGVNEPCRLAADQYFVLGDNSQDSSDSRHFGPIAASSLMGKPMLVAAPWKRRRWLPR